ncbi:MAG: DUF6445 family protein [Sphingomonas sp.]
MATRAPFPFLGAEAVARGARVRQSLAQKGQGMQGWVVTVAEQGREREPVVIIDQFTEHPARWIDDAAARSFAAIGPHYPGLRAPTPHTMLAPLLGALAPIARDVFGTPTLALVEAYYSLVTTPPTALSPIQRLPHFDGLARDRLALLHYLSTDERSGTAFYRHRRSGFETVDSARYPTYDAMLQADVRAHGLPGPAYIAGDTAMFEQVAVHAGRFNRAILYRSCTLHCAVIPPDITLAADARAGRLTVNTFLAGE